MNKSLNFSQMFPQIPEEIRNHLEITYFEIINNFREERFEPSELNGAKFCEVVFRLLEWHTNSDKSYTPFGNPINNFEQKTKKFENLTNFPDTIRFHIPKFLVTIYTLRNKRGVGHVGGDISPNHSDSTIIVNVTKWILTELIRIFYSMNIDDAKDLVERLITREYPEIWSISDKKRVLNTKLTTEEKTLLLLYSTCNNSIPDTKLINWIEYSNPSTFRKKILSKLHSEKLIEYDTITRLVHLSPKGAQCVEKSIL